MKIDNFQNKLFKSGKTLKPAIDFEQLISSGALKEGSRNYYITDLKHQYDQSRKALAKMTEKQVEVGVGSKEEAC